MNIIQPYVLNEILQLPRAQQGTISGNLGTWQEIIAIVLINPFGWLSDRIGRRPLMVFGIVVCGHRHGRSIRLRATVERADILYRVAVSPWAAACLAAMIAVVGNDYPAEPSQGPDDRLQ